MSQISADILMPLITALPVTEQHALREKLNKMFERQARPVKKKKDIYSKVGDKYRPENNEILVSEIIHGYDELRNSN